jgi:hypothetical protein
MFNGFRLGKRVKKNKDLWVKILDNLRKRKMISDMLNLTCQPHGKEMTIRTYREFEAISENGCGINCGYKLQCEHFCPKKCHRIPKFETKEAYHNEIECPEK